MGEYVQDVISGEYYMSIYGDKTEILCRKTKSIDVVSSQGAIVIPCASLV